MSSASYGVQYQLEYTRPMGSEVMHVYIKDMSISLNRYKIGHYVYDKSWNTTATNRHFLDMRRIYQFEYQFHFTCDVQANRCNNRNNVVQY